MLPPPSPAQAATALRAWQRLSLGARALTLIDTSAAMTARARPGGPDLEQMLARGAGDGLALFPDSTQMGLWTFPSHIVDSLSYQRAGADRPDSRFRRAGHPQAADPAPGAVTPAAGAGHPGRPVQHAS